MSLFDHRREQLRELGGRRGKNISEVVLSLQQDVVPQRATQLRGSGPASARSSTTQGGPWLISGPTTGTASVAASAQQAGQLLRRSLLAISDEGPLLAIADAPPKAATTPRSALSAAGAAAVASPGATPATPAQRMTPRTARSRNDDVAACAKRHVGECCGLFAKEEKKTNVREVIRDMLTNTKHSRRRSWDIGAFQDREELSMPRVPQQPLKLPPQLLSRQNRLQQSPADVAKVRRGQRMLTERLMQPRQGTLRQARHKKHGEPHEVVLGESLLMDVLMERYITSVAMETFKWWAAMVRRERYARKRSAMQAGLVWDDPERAGVLMSVRKTLVELDKLSWLKADARSAKAAPQEVRSALPHTAPLQLRSETGDDIGRVARRVAALVDGMSDTQRARLEEQEKVVLERMILRPRLKDTRRVQLYEARILHELEVTKRQVAQSTVFLSLVERLYLTQVAYTVEHAATVLAQLFADQASLQLRITAVPQLAAPLAPAPLLLGSQHLQQQPGLGGTLSPKSPQPQQPGGTLSPRSQQLQQELASTPTPKGLHQSPQQQLGSTPTPKGLQQSPSQQFGSTPTPKGLQQSPFQQFGSTPTPKGLQQSLSQQFGNTPTPKGLQQSPQQQLGNTLTPRALQQSPSQQFGSTLTPKGQQQSPQQQLGSTLTAKSRGQQEAPHHTVDAAEPVTGLHHAVMLVPCPTHTQVQDHINNLLESIFTAASCAKSLSADALAGTDADGFAKLVKNNLLVKYLIGSKIYRTSIDALDQQLKRSFSSVEQRLQRIGRNFGAPLLARVALLSELYVGSPTLWLRLGMAPWQVRGEEQDEEQEEEGEEEDLIPDPPLDAFLLHWFTGPHVRLGSLAPILRPLFRCASQLFMAASNNADFRVAPPRAFTPQAEQSKEQRHTQAARGRNARLSHFHGDLLAVAQNSANLADVILRRFTRLSDPKEASMQPLALLHDLGHSSTLCDWFQAYTEQCQTWQMAVQDLRTVYQCGRCDVDTKYLSFLGSQIPIASLGVSTYLLNLYAVYNGKLLWREVQTTVFQLNQHVNSVAELVKQLHLLSGIYPLIAKYHMGKKQLERLLYTLTGVVRGPLLLDAVARLGGSAGVSAAAAAHQHAAAPATHRDDERAGGVGGLDPAASGGASPRGGDIAGDRHATGSLATMLLSFVVKRIEEELDKLESQTDEAVATTAKRIVPFHHKVQDEIMSVNSNVQAIRLEMEQVLEPNPAFANDVRCKSAPRTARLGESMMVKSTRSLGKAGHGTGGSPTPLSNRSAAMTRASSEFTPAAARTAPAALDLAGSEEREELDAEQPLTVSGLKSYTNLEERLMRFDKQCRELDKWRRLVLQFEEFANHEGICLSVPVVNIEKVLLQKLGQYKTFWVAAHDWDRHVNSYLASHCASTNDIQRQALMTLHSIRACPKDHQRLLEERVGCLRRLLYPSLLKPHEEEDEEEQEEEHEEEEEENDDNEMPFAVVAEEEEEEAEEEEIQQEQVKEKDEEDDEEEEAEAQEQQEPEEEAEPEPEEQASQSTSPEQTQDDSQAGKVEREKGPKSTKTRRHGPWKP